jgi:hypothetical protein
MIMLVQLRSPPAIDEVKHEEAEILLKVTPICSIYNIFNLEQTYVCMHPFQVRNLDQGSPAPAVNGMQL